MNKTHLSWVNPTSNTDGTPFDAATDTAGYTLSIDDDPAGVGIPISYGTAFDMAGWAAYDALKSGSHTVQISIVSKEGEASAYSNAVTFLKEATPAAPTSLAVG